jgi:hypothetical protein
MLYCSFKHSFEHWSMSRRNLTIFPIILQVYVHQTLHAANQRSLKRGGRVMAITPRHFLDFINHFVKLYAEKRAALVK